jgi:hypothetical protein
MANQEIVDARITPDTGAIEATFTTTRPSKPILTVWRRLKNDAAQDMVPANQIAVSGETLTPLTKHSVRIANLPQGVLLWLRIKANAEDLPPSDPSGHAQLDVQTGTYVRTCLATIGSVEVLNSGDSGGGASMQFQFQIYNGSSPAGEALIELKRSSVDSIDNGEFVGDMVGQHKIESAPDVIVPYMAALHFTGGFLHFPTVGTIVAPATLPDKTGSGSNDDFQWADCLGRVTLPTALGDTHTSAFLLGTGLLVPSITATLTFETNVTNPRNLQPVLEISAHKHFIP